MAADPIFASTPKAVMVQVTTANTNRDGTGTLVDVVTAGSNGSMIHELRAVGVGTLTAGHVRLFLYDGTNNRLYDEFLVAATTPSTTVNVWMRTAQWYNMVLPSGWKLKASTNNSETFNIIVFYADI